MTIQFVGHVVSLTGSGTSMDVLVNTETSACGTRNLVLHIPREQALHWLPGRIVQFTVYTLPEPQAPNYEVTT